MTTSDTVRGTLRPSPQPHDPIRALLRAGNNDSAIVQLCAVILTQPDDLAAKELLFDAFFQKREWAPALVLAEELVRRQPDIVRLHKGLIATLSNMKRYDDVIPMASQYAARHGEDLTILDTLKVANFYSGKAEEAIRHGQRALDLRDGEARRNPISFSLKAPQGPPAGDSVISFSLWGDAHCYSYGAMINLVLSRKIYPGWRCRFYFGSDVPAHCLAFLRDHGAELRNMADEYPGVGLFQRFLVMNDPDVGRFLVRDCDARISETEAGLVRQWVDSGLPFHVARDHVMHNELMMGGMWAGRTDCGIDMTELMRRYFKTGPTAKYGHDQRMLGLMLWPLIRKHCLVHDKYYSVPDVATVRLDDPDSKVGAGYQNLARVREEAERLGIPRML